MNARTIHRLRWLAAVALTSSGFVSLVRILRRRTGASVLILRYHRILEAVGGEQGGGRFYRLGIPLDVFKEQMLFVRRHYRTIDLDTAARVLSGRAEPGDPARGISVVVTFDDGYADNIEAAHWLASVGIPATIFLIAGPIDEGRSFFWERLAALFEDSPALAELTENERRGRFDRERARIKAMGHVERENAIAQLAAELKVDPAACERPSDRPLTWREASDLAQAGTTIGGHTVTHPLLTTLPDDEVVREIGEGMKRVSTALGRSVTAFAYPTGDVDRRVRDLTARCGVTLAVSCKGGRNFPGVDLLWLRRKGVGEALGQDPDGRYSRALWATEVEGIFDALR